MLIFVSVLKNIDDSGNVENKFPIGCDDMCGRKWLEVFLVLVNSNVDKDKQVICLGNV